jgi:hypothetical protein
VTAAAVMAKMAAMMAAEMAYQKGHWFISSVSEIRIIWNITMCLGNYQKELHMLFYRHSHFSYLCSTESSIFAPNSRENSLNSPLILSKKRLSPTSNNLISNS